MAILNPWHSTRLGETVYHNNTDCTEGNNIERRYLAFGDGGLKLCYHCARLNSLVTNNLANLMRAMRSKTNR